MKKILIYIILVMFVVVILKTVLFRSDSDILQSIKRKNGGMKFEFTTVYPSIPWYVKYGLYILLGIFLWIIIRSS